LLPDPISSLARCWLWMVGWVFDQLPIAKS
jgi:hypothetical protein